MVSDEAGPLTGVNIALEGSNVGAITDTEGTFIFPKALKVGDVLVFSYLGYQTERIKIKADSSFINLQMTAEYIDIVGAPATNIPYKIEAISINEIAFLFSICLKLMVCFCTSIRFWRDQFLQSR